MSVITVLEQEHGTELDLVPTQLHLAMEGYKISNLVFFIFCDYHSYKTFLQARMA